VEVAHPLIPVAELTWSSSPSNMLPEALSEALGVSLLEVLDQYYRESDKGIRGRIISEALDMKWMGDGDQEWLDGDNLNTTQTLEPRTSIM
jgi:hypothetical protein